MNFNSRITSSPSPAKSSVYANAGVRPNTFTFKVMYEDLFRVTQYLILINRWLSYLDRTIYHHVRFCRIGKKGGITK